MEKITIYHNTKNQLGHIGFAMEFDNGIIASVQIGSGEYCCKSHTFHDIGETQGFNAEIAALKGTKFVTNKVAPDMVCPMENVIGFSNPSEIVTFLQKCKDYKGD